MKVSAQQDISSDPFDECQPKLAQARRYQLKNKINDASEKYLDLFNNYPLYSISAFPWTEAEEYAVSNLFEHLNPGEKNEVSAL